MSTAIANCMFLFANCTCKFPGPTGSSAGAKLHFWWPHHCAGNWFRVLIFQSENSKIDNQPALLDMEENVLNVRASVFRINRGIFQDISEETSRPQTPFGTDCVSASYLGSATSIQTPDLQILDPDDLAQKYLGNENSVSDDDDALCAICQESYASASGIPSSSLLHLPCSHTFHADCIHPWLARSNTCPTCRCAPPIPDGDSRRVVVARRDSHGFYELERRDSIDLLMERFDRERAAAAAASSGCGYRRGVLGSLARSVARYFSAGTRGAAAPLA
jgi:hypothetical protein